MSQNSETKPANSGDSSNGWLKFAGVCTLVALIAATAVFLGIRGCDMSSSEVAADSAVVDVEEQSNDWRLLSRLENLALACERDGRNYYFSQSNCDKIPASERARFSKKGVVVIGEGERFILDLYDSGNRMTWDEAMSRYGNRLLTKAQADVMADYYKDISWL